MGRRPVKSSNSRAWAGSGAETLGALGSRVRSSCRGSKMYTGKKWVIFEDRFDDGACARWREGESCTRRSSVWRWTKVLGRDIVCAQRRAVAVWGVSEV
jgi:hypothetical protein